MKVDLTDHLIVLDQINKALLLNLKGLFFMFCLHIIIPKINIFFILPKTAKIFFGFFLFFFYFN